MKAESVDWRAAIIQIAKNPTMIGDIELKLYIKTKTKFDMFCKLSSGKICFIANPLALIILLAPSKWAPTANKGTKINKNIPTTAPEPHTW